MENGTKRISINSITANIIRNSLYFLVFFGILVAGILPFTRITGTLNLQTATLYSFSIAGIATFIRHNSYAKYFLGYQRYRSYIGQMLMFYKHKRVIYLSDVQVWIDSENEKLKERFLKDASFHLGVAQEEDGTIDLKKFYPQEPKKPKGYPRRMTLTDGEKYVEELNNYQKEKENFKITWTQKRIIKRLIKKDYPRIPWKPSSLLNVIGDADFYVNKNVFNTEKTYKRANAAFSLIWTLFILFFAGGITASFVSRDWTVVIQAIAALFSIFAALIFGAIQGSNGGRKEERSLITANGIFKQIKPQEITKEEVEQYIRENQIVVITEDGNKTEPLNIREVAKLVVGELEIQDADNQLKNEEEK